MILRGFFAQMFDFSLRRVRLEQGVIDQAGPIARGRSLPENQSDACGAGVDDPMHALRTAMKTLGRATAHLLLIRVLAIQARIDHISDLLDQLFKIAVG